MTAKPMTEEQMVHLVRNSLLVAGQEMGDGDQWPAIKDTIYKIMKDWEQYKIARQVDNELKTHLYDQIAQMEAGLAACGTDTKARLEPKIKAWREVVDAHFSTLDRNAVFYDDEHAPEHIKRMKMIIGTLEENNE